MVILGLIIIGGGAYLYMSRDKGMDTDSNYTNNKNASTTLPIVINKSTSTPNMIGLDSFAKTFVIGTTTKGAEIIAYTYGTGTKELILVSGMHGNYSYNAINMLKEMSIDGFKDKAIDLRNTKVTVIPSLKDGDYASGDGIGGSYEKTKNSEGDNYGAATLENRLKDNKVDLNRNFDCEWKAKGKFQSYDVSGGSAPFSEPESKALRDYILSAKPVAVIAYFSAAGGVYPSMCGGKTNADSITLTSLYSKASGYTAHKSFDAYETSGDMTNWLASINVPAISVLLSDHENTELDRNMKGLQSIIDYYSK